LITNRKKKEVKRRGTEVEFIVRMFSLNNIFAAEKLKRR